MNKELQDLAWSVLPKEFKEEVKRMWSVEVDCATEYKSELHKHRTGLLYELFGEHLHWQNNLTSDAEGEEMLTVKAKTVREMYALNEDILFLDPTHKGAILLKKKLQDLFGSKCLPDEKEFAENANCSEPKPAEPKYHKGEKVRYNGYVYKVEGLVGKNRYALKGLHFDLDEDMIEPYELYTEPLSQNSPENCDNKSHISADCNKPAEPKFKIGDELVWDKHIMVKVDEVFADGKYLVYSRVGNRYMVKESDLEPYTEPTDFGRDVNLPTKNNIAIYLKKSKNCDNCLQIAAMAMQGILSNIDLFKNVLETGTETLSGDGISYRAVAKASLLFADALIDESEKRSEHGK